MSCEQPTDWLALTVSVIAIVETMVLYHLIQTKTKWGRYYRASGQPPLKPDPRTP